MKFKLRNGREVEIRQAQGTDATGIIEHLNGVAKEGLLGLASFRPPAEEEAFIRSMDHQLHYYLVVVDEGKVVGNIIATRSLMETMNHLVGMAMALDPEYRGQGLGSRLLEEALNWSKEVGAVKAILSVLAANEPALALYRKCGFQVEGTRSRQFRKLNGDGYDDEILLGKFLSL